jgi:hypothetical protein
MQQLVVQTLHVPTLVVRILPLVTSTQQLVVQTVHVLTLVVTTLPLVTMTQPLVATMVLAASTTV